MVDILKQRLYWSDEELTDINSAQSYEELLKPAMRLIKRMPQPIGQVCGPISSGGVGNLDGNIKIFNKTIKKVREKGKIVFNQIPLEDTIHRIKQNSIGSCSERNFAVLENIYAPLFESGYMKKLFFMSNWKSSRGSVWEHNKGKELNIEIIYLPENFLR